MFTRLNTIILLIWGNEKYKNFNINDFFINISDKIEGFSKVFYIIALSLSCYLKPKK